MTNDVYFGLLGPFELRVGGRPVLLRSARTRILLAALLLQPGRLVSSAELIEAVWGVSQPDNPRRALHVCLVRARASLADAGAEGLIVSGADGYRIDVPPNAVDVALFRHWIEQADAAVDRDDVAGERKALVEALSLWRGDPLADVPSDFLHRAYGVQLAEQRLHAIERRVDRSLEAGLHAEVIGDLAELTAKYPLRERLWARFMTALHQAGRRSDAINAYHAVRGRLVEELGVEPGEELRRRHATILAGDATGGVPLHIAPRQLPAEVSGFAGRAGELDLLHQVLEAHESGMVSGSTILVVSGMAGIGKTALATYWARRVADRFPDGQLWLDLRGYDGRAPATPQQSIASILGALGVPAADLPCGLDEQVGLYRSVLDGRRVLLVLDNANDVDQVLPLLPGEARAFVLITSRSDLAPLVALEGAHAIQLGPLAREDARRMLEPRLGRDRMRAEPGAVDRIIENCYGLPLALAIVAARAVGRPHFPLAAIDRQLASVENPLDRFVDPNAALDVRAVLSWSYRSLTPPTAHLFRYLALHPTADVSVPAASSLVGAPGPRTRVLLGELAAAHLISEAVPDRYVTHDLLRAYADELVARDPAEERSTAVRRMLEWFARTSLNARPLLQPSNARVDLAERADAAPSLAFHDERAAREWYESERNNLFAAVDLAYAQGFDDLCWRIAYATWVFHHLIGAWDDLLRTHETGLRAARRLGDRSAQAQLLAGMGIAYRATGDPGRSIETHRQALELFSAAGDEVGTASALSNLCAAYRDAGDLRQSLECGRAAYELDVATGERGNMAITLVQIGATLTAADRPGEALLHLSGALRLFRELGHRRGEARGLQLAATARMALGHEQEAIANYRTAIIIYRELGDRWYQAQLLTAMGDALSAGGRGDQARVAWADALAIYDALGAPPAGALRAKLSQRS
ncbi:BTAD domain-containing putative transcriptional regulator [Asanoa sp. NPDC050611]|uniref:AfsR/SARP family transcriptional regulator n=1 Tax=Asanoa sp. NPDC050611 TaxID=3157098 RepID=UPI0033EADFD7